MEAIVEKYGDRV